MRKKLLDPLTWYKTRDNMEEVKDKEIEKDGCGKREPKVMNRKRKAEVREQEENI